MKKSIVSSTLLVTGALLCIAPAHAASEEAELMKQLLQRMERLEQRNAELEQELHSIKSRHQGQQSGADNPEITTRLKSVEDEVVAMRAPTKAMEVLQNIQVEGAITTVAQRASGLPGGTADGGGKLGYRADLSVEMPLATVGDVSQKLFTHLRAGQGLGVNTALGNLGYFGNTANSVAFRASGHDPDDASAILAEAWYQARIPLGGSGLKTDPTHAMELTFGKMDVFGFFDQNEVADDESTQFLNSVFVHNPLLDAGDEVGVDGNGFQPGLIASYVNEKDAEQPWRVSFGVLGAGAEGANFEKSLRHPLLMLQVEKAINLAGHLPGNYRLYFWTRSRVEEAFREDRERRHTGFGLSIDQRIHDGVTLFGRYGQMLSGDIAYNHAIAAGAEISGLYWGRADDAIGLGASWLKTSSAYRKYGGEADRDNDGEADDWFHPSGAEKVFEAYYRYSFSDNFQLSPDFQLIKRGGGNPNSNTVKIIGLRANIAF